NRGLWDRPERRKWFGGGYDYPGIHSIMVDPRNADRIIVGISCGGAWVTEDGGTTWANQANGMRADFVPPEQGGDPDIQDPHCIVQCPADPAVLWCQHHCGIFRSTDDCQSWHAIEGVQPSDFGFVVAVHPADGDTAWFAPATKDENRIPKDGKFVVTRTRDGGKTFETLDRGLPESEAYDLIYRHGLDVDPFGDRLALGSTTGSLWISENGGDDWQAISHHLPPIFTVRFV
ncbi:MAG: exo-alpha-sialidase, partial [Verrucomicrobiae bacterium]|nr:exo-alpha-sialidase [Verrucomicrobiae bacterium]